MTMLSSEFKHISFKEAAERINDVKHISPEYWKKEAEMLEKLQQEHEDVRKMIQPKQGSEHRRFTI